MKVCRYCGQETSVEWLATKEKRKSDKIKAAVQERRKNGERIGPPKRYDYDTVRKLRKRGLTMREIAKQMGCSTNVVQRALRDLK